MLFQQWNFILDLVALGGLEGGHGKFVAYNKKTGNQCLAFCILIYMERSNINKNVYNTFR